MQTAPDRHINFARNRYYDKHFSSHAAKLLPGEFYATAEPEVIVTVLGSCVSACLRDPETGIGGMNHFMLPLQGNQVDPDATSARYGVHAMELLINELIKLGARRNHLEAKVFGGANVMPTFVSRPVGQQNADFVLEFLAAERIPVLAQDLLSSHPRKVYYFPATGRVMVRRLGSVRNATVFEREREYNQQLEQATSRGGEVDLFTD
ncbi:MAG: chemoreceptor glutamine deamidase CheD [Oleiphilaceae bacterium]|nr:chemoreceptor glutamine deamidase CheD [Oleiphilaceae bacterium]